MLGSENVKNSKPMDLPSVDLCFTTIYVVPTFIDVDKLIGRTTIPYDM